MSQKTTGPGAAKVTGPTAARAPAPTASTAGPMVTQNPIAKAVKPTEPIEATVPTETAKPAPSGALDYRTPGEKKEEYSPILQGPIVHGIVGMSTSGYGTTAQRDEIGDRIILTKEGVRLVLKEFERLGLSLKGTAHRLFITLLMQYTENRRPDGSISFPFSEFMDLCKIKDKKRAGKQLKKDADALTNLTATWNDNLYNKVTNKSQGEPKAFLNVNIFESIGQGNGQVKAQFTRTAEDILAHYKTMYFHRAALGIDLKRHPNSQYFYWVINTHGRRNIQEENEAIIGVKTILDASPAMPRYEDLKQWGGLKREIIDRFERDMDALDFAFTWHYCRKGGAPITEEDLAAGIHEHYNTFIKLNVKITFREDRPPQKELREEKEKQKRKARAPKKTQTKKP